MENKSTKVIQVLLATGALLGWFALVGQFYLILENRVASVPETILRYFSFFTILTNILVAFCFTALLIKPKSSEGRLFSPKTLTAITVYITIVGIVYNTILRFIWEPTGMQRVVDELLHSVIPILFFLYWLLFVQKEGLKWKNVLFWLLYPLVYIVFILFRGVLSGFYPYPFIDVSTIGYIQVLLNSIGLCVAFLLVSLILVTIAKIKSRVLRPKRETFFL